VRPGAPIPYPCRLGKCRVGTAHQFLKILFIFGLGEKENRVEELNYLSSLITNWKRPLPRAFKNP